MAIKWIDGFDLYSAAADLTLRPYTVAGTPTFVTGRLGSGKAMSLLNALVSWSAWGGTLVPNLSIGFALNASNFSGLAGGTKTIFWLKSGGTFVYEIGINGSGFLQAGRDFAGSLDGTSSSAVTSGSYNYFELEFTRSATVGVVNLYLNGAPVLALTGKNTGSLNIDTIDFHNSNDGVTMLIDDLYVTDAATKLGESRVDVIRPSADTATAQWTPLAGSHVSNVNQTTYDGDTSYVSDGTVGDKDLYDVTDLSFTPVTVRAVQAVLCARKDDVTTRAIRANVKSGATTANGATVNTGTSYVTTTDIYETDPNTAAAWTVANVNAAQLGIEVVT